MKKLIQIQKHIRSLSRHSRSLGWKHPFFINIRRRTKKLLTMKFLKKNMKTFRELELDEEFISWSLLDTQEKFDYIYEGSSQDVKDSLNELQDFQENCSLSVEFKPTETRLLNKIF